MTQEEKDEALYSVITHYGMSHFLTAVDEIVARIGGGVMSIPLDRDPQKAAIQLYAERMKAEGATAVIMSIRNMINEFRIRNREKS